MFRVKAGGKRLETGRELSNLPYLKHDGLSAVSGAKRGRLGTLCPQPALLLYRPDSDSKGVCHASKSVGIRGWELPWKSRTGWLGGR